MGSTARGFALVLLLAAGLAGCGGSSSPSSPTDEGTIVVESESLVPVAGACHVQGTVLNTSDIVTFNVTIRWQAFDAADKILGTTRVSVNKLKPGERRAYDATGFASNDNGLIPCSRIARFEQISASATRS